MTVLVILCTWVGAGLLRLQSVLVMVDTEVCENLASRLQYYRFFFIRQSFSLVFFKFSV